MKLFSRFIETMHMASKLEHASSGANVDAAAAMIDRLYIAGPAGQVEAGSPARDADIEETLPHPA